MSRYYTSINQKPTVDTILSITEFYLATGSEIVDYDTGGWSSSFVPTSYTNFYLWNYKRIVYADGTSEKTRPTIIWNVKEKGVLGNLTTYYLSSGYSIGITTNTSGWTKEIPTINAYRQYLWRYQVFKKENGDNYVVSPHIYETYGISGHEVILMVDDFIIPCPASLEYGLQDVSASESGRTEDTRMQKNRVGQKRTLSVQWSARGWKDTTFLMQKFNPQYIFVYYPDMLSGDYEVREYYTGDKKTPTKLWWVGKKLMESVSFDIIER